MNWQSIVRGGQKIRSYDLRDGTTVEYWSAFGHLYELMIHTDGSITVS